MYYLETFTFCESFFVQKGIEACVVSKEGRLKIIPFGDIEDVSFSL